RLLVVVDAQVAIAVVHAAVAPTLAHDEQCGALHAALVAARLLARLECGDQPVAEIALGRLESLRHRGDHALAGEDVALRAVVLAGDATGPFHALVAGERRRP